MDDIKTDVAPASEGVGPVSGPPKVPDAEPKRERRQVGPESEVRGGSEATEEGI